MNTHEAFTAADAAKVAEIEPEGPERHAMLRLWHAQRQQWLDLGRGAYAHFMRALGL